jgi:hypothetical protein
MDSVYEEAGRASGGGEALVDGKSAFGLDVKV